MYHSLVLVLWVFQLAKASGVFYSASYGTKNPMKSTVDMNLIQQVLQAKAAHKYIQLHSKACTKIP